MEQNRLKALELKRKREEETSRSSETPNANKSDTCMFLPTLFNLLAYKEEEPIPPVSRSDSILSYLTEPGWNAALADEFNKGYFKKIIEFLGTEKKNGQKVFPPENEIFNAFNYT